MKHAVLHMFTVPSELPCAAPTSRASAKDEFPDLVVNKDDETVGERAEPPAGSGSGRAE